MADCCESGGLVERKCPPARGRSTGQLASLTCLPSLTIGPPVSLKPITYWRCGCVRVLEQDRMATVT